MTVLDVCVYVALVGVGMLACIGAMSVTAHLYLAWIRRFGRGR